jgi:hypothetical protein
MDIKYPEYENLALEDAVEVFAKLNKELDEITEKKADLQNRYDVLRRAVIPKLMEDKDITSAKFSNIGRGIRIQDEFFVSSREEQREALHQWLVDHGESALIKESVASSTLKAFVSRAMKEGNEYPVDCVNVTIVPTARFY